MKHQSVMTMGALVGALAGSAVAYLFFTDGGRQVRDRIEPAVDDLMREFARFQKTIEKVGGIANEGLRVVSEITSSGGLSPFQAGGTSH